MGERQQTDKQHSITCQVVCIMNINKAVEGHKDWWKKSASYVLGRVLKNSSLDVIFDERSELNEGTPM